MVIFRGWVGMKKYCPASFFDRQISCIYTIHIIYVRKKKAHYRGLYGSYMVMMNTFYIPTHKKKYNNKSFRFKQHARKQHSSRLSLAS